MMPVCVSVTVSLAFGTTAPVASVTVPSNVAFTAWDQPTAAAAAINKDTVQSKRRRDLDVNSFSYRQGQRPVQPSSRHTPNPSQAPARLPSRRIFGVAELRFRRIDGSVVGPFQMDPLPMVLVPAAQPPHCQSSEPDSQ